MFARVECQFWDDPLIQRMDEDARHLMLYYFTTPHRNIIGLFNMPEPYALHHLKWTSARYYKALKVLMNAGRVAFDPETNLLLIVRHFKHNQLENPNQVKGAIEVLNTLPDTPLFVEFIKSCRRYHEGKKFSVEPIAESLLKRIATDPQVLEKGLETVSKPDPDPDPDQNPDADPDTTRQPPAPEAPPAPPAPPKGEAATLTDVHQVVDEYNAILGADLPKVRDLTDARITRARSMIKKHGVAKILQVFDRTSASDFLCGRVERRDNKEPWKANFDWIMKESNFVKIHEGNYDNRPGSGSRPRPGRAMEALARAVMEGGV